MRELLSIQDVDDPRRGNAKRHDLHEMLVVALLSILAGGRTCVDMALENGIPSHDTFSRLFAKLDLPPTAIGKDYLSGAVFGRAPSGTGYQLSLADRGRRRAHGGFRGHRHLRHRPLPGERLGAGRRGIAGAAPICTGC